MRTVGLLLLLFIGSIATARAQDLARGETLYRSICARCHGPDASVGSPPRVANDPAGLLRVAERIEQMRFIANGLTAQDRTDVTAYIGSVVRPSDVVPQNGWYWNAQQGGRGFFLEVRNRYVFMAGFHYEATGAATWFTAQGPVNAARLDSPMSMFQGGPALIGPYRAPQARPSPGPVSVEFPTATTARLTWLGEVIALTRFPVAGGSTPWPPQAGAPESGWWWNASEPGRGFAIEFQSDQVFIAGFMYRDDGAPTWYVAQGAMQTPTRYVGRWLAFVDGQAQGAPYRAPRQVLPDAGPLTIVFDDARHAVLTLPDGRELRLVRFEF